MYSVGFIPSDFDDRSRNQLEDCHYQVIVPFVGSATSCSDFLRKKFSGHYFRRIQKRVAKSL